VGKGLLLQMLLLALAISLDSLSVGFTYGLRGIRMSGAAHAIIATTSGVLMWLSMAAGSVLASMAPGLATTVGASLLLLLGAWHVLAARAQTLRRRAGDGTQQVVGRTLLRLHLAPLGLVIEILHDPALADADRSGVIDTREAGILGVALGLDALGAGAAAALMGISYWVVPLAALACCLLVTAGQQLACLIRRGGRSTRFAWPYTALPGLILIALGIARLAA